MHFYVHRVLLAAVSDITAHTGVKRNLSTRIHSGCVIRHGDLHPDLVWKTRGSGDPVRLTGVIRRSSAVTEQGRIQVRVGFLQCHTQGKEMVAFLVDEHLQQLVHFVGAGGAVLVQFVCVPLAQAAGFGKQLDEALRVRDGLHQVLVALL